MIRVLIMFSFFITIFATAEESIESILSRQQTLTINDFSYKELFVGTSRSGVNSMVTSVCHSIGFNRVESYEVEELAGRQDCYRPSGQSAIVFSRSDACFNRLISVTCAK